MTEEELIRFLRLDTIGIKNPRETIRRYRVEAGLEAVQISKSLFYLLPDVLAFLETLKDLNPR